MVETVQMWSDKAQEIVTWQVQLVEAKTDKGNDASVLLLTYGDEEQRYSPNTTEYELRRYVDNANMSHGPAHSNREEAALAQEDQSNG